jgi:hypothetical protein
MDIQLQSALTLALNLINGKLNALTAVSTGRETISTNCTGSNPGSNIDLQVLEEEKSLLLQPGFEL